MTTRKWAGALLVVAASTMGMSVPVARQSCGVATATIPLPMAVREASGLARSGRHASVFWTHNDAGNKPMIYAVSGNGTVGGAVLVTGAALEDWEDIESAPCGSANCLFVGDIGDNSAKRSSITVYRVVEPSLQSSATSPAAAIHARYPNGPRDAEALFVHKGMIYIVTKGREGPIELYRMPMSSGGMVTLEKVRELWPKPKASNDRITSASASPNGKYVGIRSYRTLFVFDAAALTQASGTPQPVTIDLSPVREAKGEGMSLADDGTVWLASEASGKRPPGIAALKCTLSAD